MLRLAIKVDVDTDVGTRIGVPALCDLFRQEGVPATFLFSLGPDNTGRAIKRIFRPGFLAKVGRTNVAGRYGLRTLLNGVLWPGPHIGRKNESILRATAEAGFEVGVHCYDHIRWQDGLASMSQQEVDAEWRKASDEFERIFGFRPRTAGAAGWQANAMSLKAYDEAGLLYGSDARGATPFYPSVGGRRFKTLQIPTTLPTLDELLGRPEYPEAGLVDHYLAQLREGQINVMTTHAEIEGMSELPWFLRFIRRAKAAGVGFERIETIATDLLRRQDAIPVSELLLGSVDGRSGSLAVQGH